ncbi:type VI secretion system-associated FHA domain protein TagH [Vibrio aquaticus]|uniref:Type VI secretion system-associated FHA domain protein TagH n=1 Tax=Vibrio aquaticus TaxID=2496559 RepID=A0A3S0QDZ1_9VIBR|nr:type VI secretion system-associated FHA domain protein TagH [Vibrio aquaticus]RTZ16412.1 type VI secretion system-associated FHA domain protein TagH [Vibrio aquaticus]
MEITELPKLTLLVVNAQILESKLSALISWNSHGGVIGSSSEADWQLQNANQPIDEEHCEVVVVDGAFCLRDLCGKTYLNHSDMPIGQGGLAKLVHRDRVQVGPYQIRVMLGDCEDELVAEPLSHWYPSTKEDLVADGNFDEADTPQNEPTVNTDPLSALGNGKSQGHEDSLLDDEHLSVKHPNHTLQADSEHQISSSMTLKKILTFGFGLKKKQSPTNGRNNDTGYPNTDLEVDQPTTHNVSEGLIMDEQVLDLIEEEAAKSIHSAPESASGTNHLLTGPMLNGLGVDVENTDSVERMHLLSQEMGESLQACIQGILSLHQQVNDGRFGTLNRNLQPIEDNPLRLGLSYEETIKTLYDGDKSHVHLSAAAAIRESLANVQAHNEAMQYATSEALGQILRSFSPDVLLRRFNHYKRQHHVSDQGEDAWAWEMYQNYYQELTSQRQQGFEKLFWEIFEQAYDRRIREKQMEF